MLSSVRNDSPSKCIMRHHPTDDDTTDDSKQRDRSSSRCLFVYHRRRIALTNNTARLAGWLYWFFFHHRAGRQRALDSTGFNLNHLSIIAPLPETTGGGSGGSYSLIHSVEINRRNWTDVFPRSPRVDKMKSPPFWVVLSAHRSRSFVLQKFTKFTVNGVVAVNHWVWLWMWSICLYHAWLVDSETHPAEDWIQSDYFSHHKCKVFKSQVIVSLLFNQSLKACNCGLRSVEKLELMLFCVCDEKWDFDCIHFW